MTGFPLQVRINRSARPIIISCVAVLCLAFAGAATGARYNIVFNAGIQTYTSGNPNASWASSAATR